MEYKHKVQIKNYALDFPRIWTVLLMQPPLQNKRGQKRGNCGFPRNCHEFHVLHGSAFMESVDTCENHTFHIPWIIRKEWKPWLGVHESMESSEN